VGIVGMFFFFFFRNRLIGIISAIQQKATFLIDILSGEVRVSDEDDDDRDG
jgi:hypothetical protein